MIILDTNVISEPMLSRPNPRIVEWLDEQDFETLYVTTITIAEILYGIRAAPDGKRKAHLQHGYNNKILPLFKNRILPFDYEAANDYAEFMAQAKKVGRAIGQNDAYIAAIAKCHNMLVATRDVAPFEAVGIEVINPWTIK